MTQISPRLIFGFGGQVFANGSQLASNHLGPSQPADRLADLDIDQGLNKIASLAQGSSRVPTQAAVELSSEWLRNICKRAVKLGGWRRPHISSTEAGEVVFEWWNRNRNLTLYFSAEGAEYIEVWGPDMDNEMVSGPLGHWSFITQWRRLQS